MFPRKAIGSIVGFGGMAGAVGGMLIATLAGFILEFTGSYLVLFIICGSMYILAYLVFIRLAPKLEQVEL
jgi:ACS family hexuronate transporter-like MFS transporter